MPNAGSVPRTGPSTARIGRRARLATWVGVWTLLALASADPGHAASPFDHHHRFARLSIDDGLSQSIVLTFLQDRQGFIWLGTQDGLNRYERA